MNFDDAIRAHASWKFRLRQAIDSGDRLDPAVVGRDDQCDLGRWLHGGGCAAGPARAEVLSAHADFHRAVGAIVRLANAGQKEAALRELAPFGTEFARQTTRVIQALTALKAAAA